MSQAKIIECIKRNHSFLITAHTNPEGDALGSELACAKLLEALSKKAVIVNADATPCGLRFLPSSDKIQKFRQRHADIRFDCFVALDCSDLSRCGKAASLNSGNKPILNIDHHISNSRFGRVNWVEPSVSSCSEMIYMLYKKLRVPFEHDTAQLLYIGIMTDTGSFRYSNTSARTHSAVADLMKYDLDVTAIYNALYGNIPFAEMKLLAGLLSTVATDSSGRIAWVEIPRESSIGQRFPFDFSEYILNFERSIKNVDVALLLRQDKDKRGCTRVNLRSHGRIDVNKIASFFGGGGHRTASGCTVSGSTSVVRKKVVAKIQRALGR